MDYDKVMQARIYLPSKTAMQSGLANTLHWILEYEPEKPKQTDNLIGWIGSSDMRGQVRLLFDTKEEAIAYAERNEIAYQVLVRKPQRIRPKSYSDNFRYQKIE